MPTSYAAVQADLARTQRRWLVTGAAGFIGSHLVEALLRLGQDVVGLDNLTTGHRRNLDEVAARTEGAPGAFAFLEGDIRDADACAAAAEGAELVLHQAAIGSVNRSISDPRTSHDVNVNGTLNVFLAARDAGARRVVYASSSSVYGDATDLPMREERIGTPLSPYAVTKRTNELYAAAFGRHYGLSAVGLRYFNVYGARQNPEGPYAAVLPTWATALLAHAPCQLHGNGETSRDFCHVANVVQANLLAALTPGASGVYNVAGGQRTTLPELFAHLRTRLARHDAAIADAVLVRVPSRAGDIRHSLADLGRAAADLGYAPEHAFPSGLDDVLAWYAARALARPRPALAS